MSDLILSDTDSDLSMIESTAKRFVVAGQIAQAMCQASILPEHLRTRKVAGKVEALSLDEIKANCVLIVNQALRWGVDPFAILPSTFVIGGNLGFDGKLIAAIVNKLGGLSKKLSYEFAGEGQNRTVTVSGQLHGEDEPRTVSVTVKDAKTDNAIWTKDPDQKLVYTGATRWARRHCPHVILGIVSDDEPAGEIIDAVSTSSVAIEEPSPAPAKLKVDINGVIERYKQEIAEATDEDSLTRIGDRINAELAIPEPARKDLRASWIARREELTTVAAK